MGAHDDREMLEVAKEEVGRLERENAELLKTLKELMPADVLVEGTYFPVRDLPTILGNFMRSSADYARDAKREHVRAEHAIAERDKALAERDAALTVIAGVREWNMLLNGEPRYRQCDDVLIQSPTDALAEHDRQVAEAAAERAAKISETAILTHEIGRPGEGPFTNGQRYADEAREQIAAKIRAEYRKAGN